MTWKDCLVRAETDTKELKRLIARANQKPGEGEQMASSKQTYIDLYKAEYTRCLAQGHSHDQATEVLRDPQTHARLRKAADEIEKSASAAWTASSPRPRATTSPELLRSSLEKTEGSVFIGEMAAPKGSQRMQELVMLKTAVVNAEQALRLAKGRGAEHEEEMELHQAVLLAEAAYDAVRRSQPLLAKYHEAPPDAPIRPRVIDVGGTHVLQGPAGYIERLVARARLTTEDAKLGQLKEIAERLRNAVDGADDGRGATSQMEAEASRAAEARAEAAEADYESQRALVEGLRATLQGN